MPPTRTVDRVGYGICSCSRQAPGSANGMIAAHSALVIAHELRTSPGGSRSGGYKPGLHCHGAVGAVAGDSPPAAVTGGVLGGALPAEDRLLDGETEVLEPTVGLGVGVWVTVAVWVWVWVGVVPTELDSEGVTVTVVGSVVVSGSGEVFPPMIVSPEFPPDSGPPLTFSTNVTVAMLPAKITAAAAAPASTTVSGRRDRLGATATGWAARAMTTVGSSSGRGVPRGDGHRPGTSVVAAPAGVVSAGRTSRSAFDMWRRVTSRDRP
jgi:hypothetical protein